MKQRERKKIYRKEISEKQDRKRGTEMGKIGKNKHKIIGKKQRKTEMARKKESRNRKRRKEYTKKNFKKSKNQKTKKRRIKKRKTTKQKNLKKKIPRIRKSEKKQETENGEKKIQK